MYNIVIHTIHCITIWMINSMLYCLTAIRMQKDTIKRTKPPGITDPSSSYPFKNILDNEC